MCSFLAGVLLIFILSGACVYEGVRWYSTQEECQLKRNNFHKLLASDVCKAGYGETVDAACAKANLELRTSLIMCTAAGWWRGGEVYRIYTLVTDSYIFLGILILVPILYAIRSTFDYLNQRSTDDRVERLLRARDLLPPKGGEGPVLQALPSWDDYHPAAHRQRRSGMRSNFVYHPDNQTY